MPVFMNDEAFIKKGYQISTDKTLLDFDAIFNYLEGQSYWAKGMPPEKFKKAITHSLCFGIYRNGIQAGFARVVTDMATFGYLCDVFVLPAYQGVGLSKWLMQTIMAHPDLQGLRRWSLATLDAHGLYKQFGFTPITNTERWMQILTPYIAD
ncbi:GNAT family N-acetyltransferase [Mucilaginibacter sp. RB4R14]|uniref:GNAT family N-acetyltransferase n=1 Tax=Mucilaginibacter aurantiaciroseus TaxID=2949308 RepID=UPI0020915DCC|nr:GNAT family N-acetyltransferase [Mucilaginibacter aurantiaciroseus]MCO5935045.1 GNAT family N-acetyltransferase [Mucilaginibacter aurantiaciroseus]